MHGTPTVAVSVFALLLFQVCALFARALLELNLVRRGIDATDASHLSYLIVPVILAVLMYPMLRANGRYLRSLLRIGALSIRIFVTALAIAFCARLVWWTQLVARTAFGMSMSDDPAAPVGPLIAVGCPPLPWLLLGVLVTAVLVPVVEEVVHRGLILGALKRRGQSIAILVSAAVFAAFHPGSLDSVVTAFLLGIVFGLQVTATCALWASIVTHAGYNGLLQLDWHCVQTVWNPGRDTLPDLTVGIAASLALLGALAMLIVLLAKTWDGASHARRPVR